jgi:hypothetical protein
MLKFENTLTITKPFIWLDYNDSYLKELREKYRLKELVSNANGTLSVIEKITNWVHHLWEHDGENEPSNPDPLSILEEVSKGKRFRCVEYSIVLTGCLNALGIYSRKLALKTKDCETREIGAGHVVAECFVPELNKWIMVDPQVNAIVFANGIPLNAVELAEAIHDGKKIDIPKAQNREQVETYLNFISPYLYYFSVKFDNRENVIVDYNLTEQLMLIPLGAKKPTIFQKKYPIGNLTFTHSLNDFYKNPLEVM